VACVSTQDLYFGIVSTGSQPACGRRSAIDRRTTPHPSYEISQRVRKRILARGGDTDVELGLRLDTRGDSRRPHLHRAIATCPRQPAGAAACLPDRPMVIRYRGSGGDHGISLVPCRGEVDL
jgi:hypothetical protein